MKKYHINVLMIILVAMGITSYTCMAKIKYAQTGFQFLSVISDARASAMGEAMTSLEESSSSLFFNPAGMANMHDKMISVAFSLNSWIADIKHSTFSIAANPYEGKYGVIGLAIQYVDYGEIQGTMVWDNEAEYIDTEIMHPSAMAVGFGYAKMLSDKFSVGGQIKFVYQNLAKSVIPSVEVGEYISKKNVEDGMAVDFGTLYKTGFKSLAFGMSVRNFSEELKFEQENFQLPLLFTIGISMDLMDFDFIQFSGTQHSLLMSIDATHPRAHREQIKVGLDYRVMNVLSLRGGYIANNDEDDFSFGFGIFYSNVNIDYAYTPFGIFDRVQRITARLSF